MIYFVNLLVVWKLNNFLYGRNTLSDLYNPKFAFSSKKKFSMISKQLNPNLFAKDQTKTKM